MNDVYSIFRERYTINKCGEFWKFCNEYSNFNVYSDKCWKCPEKYSRCLKRFDSRNQKMPEYFFMKYDGLYPKNSIFQHIKPSEWTRVRFNTSFDELTKELAVQLHRDMWNSIANANKKRMVFVNPFEWFEDHGYISYSYMYPDESPFGKLGVPDFWPCKYARMRKNLERSKKFICTFCPIKWPGDSSLQEEKICKCISMSSTSNGLYSEYMSSFDYYDKKCVDFINFVLEPGVNIPWGVHFMSRNLDREVKFDYHKAMNILKHPDHKWRTSYGGVCGTYKYVEVPDEFIYGFIKRNAYILAKEIANLEMSDV